MTCFPQFSAFLAKQIHKMHKITSDFYDMRKILTKKIWSQGTYLGSLGPGSREALGLGACRFQILVIWALNEPPALTACETHAKNPKTAGAWCVQQKCNLEPSECPCNPKILQSIVLNFRHENSPFLKKNHYLCVDR